MSPRNNQTRRERARELVQFLCESQGGSEAGLEALWIEHPDLKSELRSEFMAQMELSSEHSIFGRMRRGEKSVDADDGARAGDVIGDYVLIKRIGRGGQGEVWQAEQSSLNRAVALKLVLPGRVNAKTLALLAREARAGGRLAHPGIVAVYSSGEDDGRSWIAQELVEGSWTLRDFIDEVRNEDKLPENYYRAVALFVAELADALHAAHEGGIIHRDVKPQNVLVTKQDQPKLTDFGLARITDEEGMSMTGDFAGTWLYMSPEQVTAKRIELDHRTDIFSLGVVMYEMLALVRPFDGDTTHQIAENIVLREPPDLRKIRSRVPKDLAVICAKALEKLRENRFASMAEVAADLRRHLANEPIHAQPPTLLDRGWKWMRRNPTKCAVVAVAAGAYLVISYLSFHLMRLNYDLELKTQEALASEDAAEDSARESRESADIAQRKSEEIAAHLLETREQLVEYHLLTAVAASSKQGVGDALAAAAEQTKQIEPDGVDRRLDTAARSLHILSRMGSPIYSFNRDSEILMDERVVSLAQAARDVIDASPPGMRASSYSGVGSGMQHASLENITTAWDEALLNALAWEMYRDSRDVVDPGLIQEGLRAVRELSAIDPSKFSTRDIDPTTVRMLGALLSGEAGFSEGLALQICDDLSSEAGRVHLHHGDLAIQVAWLLSAQEPATALDILHCIAAGQGDAALLGRALICEAQCELVLGNARGASDKLNKAVVLAGHSNYARGVLDGVHRMKQWASDKEESDAGFRQLLESLGSAAIFDQFLAAVDSDPRSDRDDRLMSFAVLVAEALTNDSVPDLSRPKLAIQVLLRAASHVSDPLPNAQNSLRALVSAAQQLDSRNESQVLESALVLSERMANALHDHAWNDDYVDGLLQLLLSAERHEEFNRLTALRVEGGISAARDTNSKAWSLIDPDLGDQDSNPALGLWIVGKALEHAPTHPPVLRTHSWALFANSRYDEAVRESERALKFAPEEEKAEYQADLDRLRTMIAGTRANNTAIEDDTPQEVREGE